MNNKGMGVDQPEYDAQETNTNKKVEATPDPDMIRRVTGSGAALLKPPSSSTLKSVAFNPEYDMTIITSSTQHSLAALKVGINSQDRKPLTPVEKSILFINYKELSPHLSFQTKPKYIR